MPDLIRHPVTQWFDKNTGFRVEPGMTITETSLFLAKIFRAGINVTDTVFPVSSFQFQVSVIEDHSCGFPERTVRILARFAIPAQSAMA